MERINAYNYAPRAFGYCRKSTTGQREESIEAQQRAIVSYAAASGFELVKVYKDHGNSGRNGERPQFTQMVQDAIEGGAQFIIVHKLDRFFRNAERQTLQDSFSPLSAESSSLSAAEQLLIDKFRALDARGQSAVLNILEHEYAALYGDGASCPVSQNA